MCIAGVPSGCICQDDSLDTIYNIYHMQVLGKGTWGVVTQCEGPNGEIVALKTFEDANKNDLVCKVAIREAKGLKAVKDHPNVVGLIEVFRTSSNLYLVLEFVDHTLLDLMQNHANGMPSKQMKTYMFQLAGVLSFMHERKLIHRDLKPENGEENKTPCLL